jgi:hypothetical protein
MIKPIKDLNGVKRVCNWSIWSKYVYICQNHVLGEAQVDWCLEKSKNESFYDFWTKLGFSEAKFVPVGSKRSSNSF